MAVLAIMPTLHQLLIYTPLLLASTTDPSAVTPASARNDTEASSKQGAEKHEVEERKESSPEIDLSRQATTIKVRCPGQDRAKKKKVCAGLLIEHQ